MRIIVFGAGALGSLFAALLSRQNEVYMVGRREHVLMVSTKGLDIEGNTEGNFSIAAGETLKESPFYPNWIILTVKAYQTEEAGREILDVFPEVPVVSFQNGIENELVLKNMGINAVGGVTSHGVTFLGPGKILHAGTGRTAIGEIDSRSSMRVRALAYVLSEAGILTEVSGNITGEIWLKAAVNAVINPLTAVLGVRNGALISIDPLRKLGDSIASECSEIAEAHGIEMPSDPKDEWKTVAERTAENMSSALQDIINGKRTEIREINGAFVRKAEEKGIDAMYNRAMMNMALGKEKINKEPNRTKLRVY